MKMSQKVLEAQGSDVIAQQLFWKQLEVFRNLARSMEELIKQKVAKYQGWTSWSMQFRTRLSNQLRALIDLAREHKLLSNGDIKAEIAKLETMYA